MSILFNRINCLLLLILLTACTGGAIKSDSTSPQGDASVSGSTAETFNRAISAMAENNYTKAESLLSDLTSDNPGLPGPWNNLGIIKYKNADYASAKRYASKAIELKPSYAEAYNLVAMAEVQLGEINTAKEHYTEALRLKPDYATAHYNMALLYDIYYQDIDNAILHYIKYLELIGTEDNTTREWLEQLIRQRKQ